MSDDQLSCEICNKVFKNKQGLEYHVKNNVCRKFSCKFCGNRFKSSLGLHYHEDKRICLPPEKIKVNIVRKTQYHTYTLSKDEIRLRDVMNVTPNFGAILFGSANIIIKFCELALTNDELDQYWAYYINNKREQFINVYDGDRWTLQPQSQVFSELSAWVMILLHKYLTDNKHFIDNRTYWTKYFFTKDYLSKEKHSIHKEIRQGLFCLFVNHKNKIKEKGIVTGLKLKA